MIWEGSVLDANEGIRFHGKTIEECQNVLPKGTSGTEMLPEAMFWLLLTGQVPSTLQIRAFSRELAEKSSLPTFVLAILQTLPLNMHPMTQFACIVSALNVHSAFAKAYNKGIQKADYWEPTFDDCISLLAKLPTIAAWIHQHNYKKRGEGLGQLPAKVDPEQDWSYNFAAMLGKGGKGNENFQDLLRLYLALHGDHEGGNVSAHATHLVGSALSDPFLSYSAGLQGLAGPLHGYIAPSLHPPFHRSFKPHTHRHRHTNIPFASQTRRPRSPPLDPQNAIPHRRLLHRRRHKILPLVHPFLRPSNPRLRARRVAQGRPALHRSHELRLRPPGDRRGPSVPARATQRRDRPGSLERARQDEEPLPERRQQFRRAVPPLRLPGNALLHRHLWRLARPGTVGAIDLGPRAGVTDRAAQKYQSGRTAEAGGRWESVVSM